RFAGSDLAARGEEADVLGGAERQRRDRHRRLAAAGRDEAAAVTDEQAPVRTSQLPVATAFGNMVTSVDDLAPTSHRTPCRSRSGCTRSGRRTAPRGWRPERAGRSAPAPAHPARRARPTT